jgi:glycosyltransferase involved in cell wall biosynthesis
MPEDPNAGDDVRGAAPGRPPGAPGVGSYRLVGFLGGEFGLAVAARNTLHALTAAARPVVAVPIDVGAPTRAVSLPPDAPPAGPSDLNLFHMNPVEIVTTRRAWSRTISRDAAAACVPFWELPLLPHRWLPVLEGMDLVLAPTRFIQEACARALPRTPVLHHPQAVFLPAVAPEREAWGFAAGTTVFVLAFDVGSDVDRKNPLAAIEAFQRAFPSERDVLLVVKTKPYPSVPALEAQARALRERVAGDARIRIVERSMAYPELLRLYASCDVMLSLHRSEGLGLHLMEAMSLGRPVVATGWSGNMDFMTPENSIALGWAPVPVRARHLDYAAEVGREGQVWAEPALADAVEALRLLHRDRTRRELLGSSAARDMERRRRDVLAGAVFGEVEAHLARTARDPGRFWRGLRRAAWSLRVETLRRRARRVAGLLAPGRRQAT